MKKIAILVAFLSVASAAWAQPAIVPGAGTIVTPAQGGVNLNQSQTSAAATSNVITLGGVAGTRIRVYSVSVNCSAGTATISVTDGGTTVNTYAGSPVPAAPAVLSLAWTPVPYTSTAAGNSIVITAGSCGGGNTSTLNVQADRY